MSHISKNQHNNIDSWLSPHSEVIKLKCHTATGQYRYLAGTFGNSESAVYPAATPHLKRPYANTIAMMMVIFKSSTEIISKNLHIIKHFKLPKKIYSYSRLEKISDDTHQFAALKLLMTTFQYNEGTSIFQTTNSIYFYIITVRM